MTIPFRPFTRTTVPRLLRTLKTAPPRPQGTSGTQSRRLTQSSLPLDSLPRYPSFNTLGILRGLDYVGTISFASSGAILAASSGMDLLGATMIGTITAVGGGTIRDALILNKKPFWTAEPEYLYLCLLASTMSFSACLFYPWFASAEQNSTFAFLADALGVGAFCVIGAQNGLRAGLPNVVVGLCGMATATFGGVVRDVLCNKKVRILHSYAEIYATTAAAGAAGYMVARRIGMGVAGRVGVGVGLAVGLRSWARSHGVRLPVWTRDELKEG